VSDQLGKSPALEMDRNGGMKWNEKVHRFIKRRSVISNG
jgi:hypothetical protein